MFTRKFERRIYIAIAVFLFSGVLGVSFGAYVLWPSRRETGYEPAQPIPFNHQLHAGTLKIDCIYCHSEAEKGPQATVPGASTCLDCHTQVRPKDEKGNLKPGIPTLLEHWESGEPIIWNKVYDVADFVYFDHSRHLAVGLECDECHGPVDEMVHLRRVFGLKMSWCLDCHKQDPQPGQPAFDRDDSTRAPIHCTTCHR